MTQSLELVIFLLPPWIKVVKWDNVTYMDTETKLYVKVKLLSHVWLCDPMDYTLHEILQARILEWVAFAFSRGSSQPRDWTEVSRMNKTKTSRFLSKYFTIKNKALWLLLNNCLKILVFQFYSEVRNSKGWLKCFQLKCRGLSSWIMVRCFIFIRRKI